MARLLIVAGKISVVTREIDEDTEHYWDRAWGFAVATAAATSPVATTSPAASDPEANRARFEESRARAYERRGCVY